MGEPTAWVSTDGAWILVHYAEAPRSSPMFEMKSGPARLLLLGMRWGDGELTLEVAAFQASDVCETIDVELRTEPPDMSVK